MQDGNYLDESANDEAYTYYINPSDTVSKALWQKMSDKTVARSYVAKPKYSPVTAHSVSQWYEGFDEATGVVRLGLSRFGEQGTNAASKKDELAEYSAILRSRIATDNATRD